MDRENSRWPYEQGQVLHSRDRIREWLHSEPTMTRLTNPKTRPRSAMFLTGPA